MDTTEKDKYSTYTASSGNQAKYLFVQRGNNITCLTSWKNKASQKDLDEFQAYGETRLNELGCDATAFGRQKTGTGDRGKEQAIDRMAYFLDHGQFPPDIQ